MRLRLRQMHMQQHDLSFELHKNEAWLDVALNVVRVVEGAWAMAVPVVDKGACPPHAEAKDAVLPLLVYPHYSRALLELQLLMDDLATLLELARYLLYYGSLLHLPRIGLPPFLKQSLRQTQLLYVHYLHLHRCSGPYFS
jgi:hypothetical protein